MIPTGFALREAFRNLRDTKVMSFISIGTITLSLLVFGSFVLITLKLLGTIDILKSRMEIEVYLSDDMPDDALPELLRSISMVPGTMKSHVVTKEEALKEFRKIYGEGLIMIEGDNPLPRSIRLTFAPSHRSLDSLRVAQGRILRVPTGKWISDIDYGGRFVEKAENIILLFIIVDVFLGVVISLASVFVIANTVELTVLAHTDTIEIMQLVGATNRFIRLPFKLEGTIQGLAGGILASCILYGCYTWVVQKLPALSIHLELVAAEQWSRDFGPELLLLLIPIGGFLGNLGARFALRMVIR